MTDWQLENVLVLFFPRIFRSGVIEEIGFPAEMTVVKEGG